MQPKTDVCRFFPTLDGQCSLFSRKNPVILIFCISGWLAVPVNPDKWVILYIEDLKSVRWPVNQPIHGLLRSKFRTGVFIYM